MAVLWAPACAREPSDQLNQELLHLDADAGDGVAKVQRALGALDLSSTELGEGVREVEAAARALSALEDDAAASDVQQLQALVLSARAFDDLAITLTSSPPPPGLDATQRAVLTKVLDEKAVPARVAALLTYARALERACRTGLEHHALVADIADGLSRSGEQVSLDHPCAEQ